MMRKEAIAQPAVGQLPGFGEQRPVLPQIGDQTHLLPLKADVRMRSSKLLTKNLVEFHLYRKFGADTSITFDTPDALPDEQTKEQPPK